MKAVERRLRLVGILVNQLREEYNADISFKLDLEGNVTLLRCGVPTEFCEEALPLFLILRNYLRPAYRKRRRKIK